MASNPLLPPIFPAGKEPLPPGFTEEDRAQMMQAKKMQDYMNMGVESCAFKTIATGAGGVYQKDTITLLYGRSFL